MHVVEIVVRFGDTILDVARVGATAGYRIGTGRDVDVAVELAGLRSFPILDGFMLRLPAGIAASPAVASPYPLKPGDALVVTIGAVSLELAMVEVAPALPRVRAFDPRPAIYGAGSLIVHLVALVLVTVLAVPEAETAPADPIATVMASLPRRPIPIDPARPVQRTFARSKPRSKPLPQPQAVSAIAQAPILAEEPDVPRTREQATARARKAGLLGGTITAEQYRAITGTVDLEKALSDVGPVWLEYEAEAKGFGGGRRFDPTKDPRFDSVHTGRYATVATGHAAGDYYDLPGAANPRRPPRVELGSDRAEIRGLLAPITACYARTGSRARVELAVTFDVDADGKVRRPTARGDRAVGACVAAIVARLELPAARRTRVAFPITFW